MLAHITGISPSEDLSELPHCLIRYHPGLWLDRSIITGLLTRVGLDKPASMRNSPPQAALWTDGHRSAPSLAVFDAVPRTGGLGASSSVASAPLPEASRQRTYPAAGYEVFKGQAGGFEEPLTLYRHWWGVARNFYFSANFQFLQNADFTAVYGHVVQVRPTCELTLCQSLKVNCQNQLSFRLFQQFYCRM